VETLRRTGLERVHVDFAALERSSQAIHLERGGQAQHVLNVLLSKTTPLQYADITCCLPESTSGSLTPDQVAAELAHGEVLLMDVRKTEKRADKGTIPAVHAPREMLDLYA
jgi:hypothetical protein